MKITKRQLKQIIKEEKAALLGEGMQARQMHAALPALINSVETIASELRGGQWFSLRDADKGRLEYARQLDDIAQRIRELRQF